MSSSKKAMILGLFREEGLNAAAVSGYDVITLNDWYRAYPWLIHPMVIMNLHTEKDIEEAKKNDRYPGDWKAIYNQSGAMIVIPPGVSFRGISTVEFPIEEIQEAFEKPVITCGIAAMIYMAAILGYREILIRGVRLRDEEYRYEIRSILKAISDVSAVAEIDCPYLDEWEERKARVPWEKIDQGWHYIHMIQPIGGIIVDTSGFPQPEGNPI